jgi:hypothetical protein
MRAAQSRQKSYADKRRRPLAFEVGDYVYQKLSPMKNAQRFRLKRKLTQRYVLVFHVSQLKEVFACA